MLWASFEANAHARRRRGGLRSDDIILALLAIQEVAVGYPHLTGAVTEQYAGSRALRAAGADYREALRIVEEQELGTDPVPPQKFLGRGTGWPPDTTALLRRVLANPDNRSNRLLNALGVDATTLPLGL